MESKAKNVVLGVTGGVGAYKACELARKLVESGFVVDVVVTSSATRFAPVSALRALINGKVHDSLYEDPDPSPHTTLARCADLIVCYPATADFIAKTANGHADDLLSALFLASTAPKIVVPAMHTEMWEAAATQRNIRTLNGDGVRVIGPGVGSLAGGDYGPGRLISSELVALAVRTNLGPASELGRDLEGRRVLVTAGGTREAIDPVRYVGNRSSGKQGAAIAAVAALAGAEVTLVTTSETSLVEQLAEGMCEVVVVESAREMAAAVAALEDEIDILVMAAAVADFSPRASEPNKIKREGREELSLLLTPTEDILRGVALRRAKRSGVLPVLVGFAAETQDLESAVSHKLGAKGVDVIVGNLVAGGAPVFGADENQVMIVDRLGDKSSYPRAPKEAIACRVLAAALRMLKEASVVTE